MRELYEMLSSSFNWKIVIWLVAFDMFVGLMRCIKERKINSTCGIDGVIRKVCMIGSVVFLEMISTFVSLDLSKFVPSEILSMLPIKVIGITEFFVIGYVLYEVLSILKNIVRIGNPINNRLIALIEKFLNMFTGELDIEKQK